MFKQYRYGGENAYAALTAGEICNHTGLSRSTTKRALAALTEQGLISRPKKRGRLVVHLQKDQNRPKQREGERVSMVNPRKVQQAEPVPISLSLSNNTRFSFTPKQEALISRSLADASQMLGGDAADLEMLCSDASNLGLEAGISYGQAKRVVQAAGDTRRSRDYVGAVSRLASDEGIQGRWLRNAGCDGYPHREPGHQAYPETDGHTDVKGSPDDVHKAIDLQRLSAFRPAWRAAGYQRQATRRYRLE